MNTPDVLTATEVCARRGYWSRDWESNRLTGVEMLQRALHGAMLEPERTDLGELAGETVMELAHDRGMETKSHEVYQSACHHACLADILVNSLVLSRREGVWRVPETQVTDSYAWTSGALLDPSGAFLRRFVFASQWSDERKFQEMYSWDSLGEVCQYKLPMQMVVFVLGPHRDGRRHSPWTKALVHPRSGKLRFRKKSQSQTTTFKDSYRPIWREDHAEIAVTDWLQAMQEDDVLKEVMLRVDVPVPGSSDIGRVLDMTERKMERLQRLTKTPEPNLSTCWHPSKCQFFDCCWGKFKEPSEKAGFLPIAHLPLHVGQGQ